jgi:hypothetical protein
MEGNHNTNSTLAAANANTASYTAILSSTVTSVATGVGSERATMAAVLVNEANTNGQQAILYVFVYHHVALQGHSAHLPVYYIAATGNVNITLDDMTGTGVLQLTNARLADRVVTTRGLPTQTIVQGVATQPANPHRPFTSSITVGNLRLTEDGPGSLPARHGADNGGLRAYIIELKLDRSFEFANFTSSNITLTSTWSDRGLNNGILPAAGSPELTTLLANSVIRWVDPQTVHIGFEMGTQYANAGVSLNEDVVTIAGNALTNLRIFPSEGTNYNTAVNLSMSTWLGWVSTDAVTSRYVSFAAATASLSAITRIVGTYVTNEVTIPVIANPAWLRSGVNVWSLTATTASGLIMPAGPSQANGGSGNLSLAAINSAHRTSPLRIQETVPGSWTANGVLAITFDFGPGVKVLGVHVASPTSANNMTIPVRDGSGRVSLPGNGGSIVVRENSVVYRPDFSLTTAVTWRDISFYLSVEPGYAASHGETIFVDVTADGRTGVPSERRAVARVWDPISVEVNEVKLDEVTIANFGTIHAVPMGRVTVKETSPGVLTTGTTIQFRIEDFIGRSGSDVFLGHRDSYINNVARSSLAISRPRVNTAAGIVEFDITRQSRPTDEAAEIVFYLAANGRVFRDLEYLLNVFGSEIADNYQWNPGSLGSPTNFEHPGIFTEGSYQHMAVYYVDSERGTTTGEPDPVFTTIPRRLLGPTGTYTTSRNEVLGPRIFENVGSTGYVMAAVVADILGMTSWFDNGNIHFANERGDHIMLTVNSTTALVNGRYMPIRDSAGNEVPARILDNNRTYVPIKFFEYCGIFGPLSIDWDGTTGVAGGVVIISRP